MRVVLLLLFLLMFAACAGFVDRVEFRALDDLRTTQPRSLAEGGHSTLVTVPGGLRWALRLSSITQTPRQGIPQKRYELIIDLEEVSSAAQGWQPALADCVLVDEEGRSLRLSDDVRVDRARSKGSDQHTRRQSYLVRFPLPLAYHFRGISRLTLHWALQAQGHPLLRISSRFRR